MWSCSEIWLIIYKHIYFIFNINMQIIGISLILFFILWLFLHREKNQETYADGLASGASWLPQLTKHYVGID